MVLSVKTEINISVRAYLVEIRDNRTGEKSTDTIVLDKERLKAGGLLGLSDEDIIRRTYNREGFYVKSISNPTKHTITIDLQQLFAQAGNGGVIVIAN